MALKKFTDATQAATPAPIEPSGIPNILLELALYNLYTRGGVTYEKGKAYRFDQNTAIMLMSEQDMGRPVWRQYVAPPQVRKRETEIVDQTRRVVEPPPAETAHAVEVSAPKRLDIGDDSELADLGLDTVQI
jgi:hypothetical protein